MTSVECSASGDGEKPTLESLFIQMGSLLFGLSQLMKHKEIHVGYGKKLHQLHRQLESDIASFTAPTEELAKQLRDSFELVRCVYYEFLYYFINAKDMKSIEDFYYEGHDHIKISLHKFFQERFTAFAQSKIKEFVDRYAAEFPKSSLANYFTSHAQKALGEGKLAQNRCQIARHGRPGFLGRLRRTLQR